MGNRAEPFARLSVGVLGDDPRRARRVGQLMTHEVVVLQDTQTMQDAMLLLEKHPFHHLPVVHGQRAVGVLSDRDLLPFLRGDRPLDTLVRDVMSTPPRCIESDTSLSEAAKLFLHFGFRCLIVVDDERRKVVQGIVTTMDLLRALI